MLRAVLINLSSRVQLPCLTPTAYLATCLDYPVPPCPFAKGAVTMTPNPVGPRHAGVGGWFDWFVLRRAWQGPVPALSLSLFFFGGTSENEQ
eukprot:4466813-Amphidinium_carterae.2